MSTPIQKRLAADRSRSIGVLYLVAAGFFAILALVALILHGRSELFPLFPAVFAGFCLVNGLLRLREARRRRDALEAEFGPGAGVQ